VGIGTASPAGKLQVTGSSASFILNTSGTEFYNTNAGTVKIYASNAAGALALSAGGRDAGDLFINSSGNVGIGMTPSNILDITQNQNSSATSKILNNSAGTGARVDIVAANGTAQSQLTTFGTGYSTSGIFRANGTLVYATGAGGLTLSTDTAQPIYFATNQTERARIDSSGNLLVGRTSIVNPASSSDVGLTLAAQYNVIQAFRDSNNAMEVGRQGNNGPAVVFYKAGVSVGDISVTGSTTSYNSGSDYRLKNITGLLTSSGAFIDALKPKVGTWKADGSKFVGFIAHEFAEVSPSSVSGEKDAVDADGNPKYQAMQASSAEVIANLVAELQSVRQRLAALEA
jgi:hypothetical protein